MAFFRILQRGLLESEHFFFEKWHFLQGRLLENGLSDHRRLLGSSGFIGKKKKKCTNLYFGFGPKMCKNRPFFNFTRAFIEKFFKFARWFWVHKGEKGKFKKKIFFSFFFGEVQKRGSKNFFFLKSPYDRKIVHLQNRPKKTCSTFFKILGIIPVYWKKWKILKKWQFFKKVKKWQKSAKIARQTFYRFYWKKVEFFFFRKKVMIFLGGCIHHRENSRLFFFFDKKSEKKWKKEFKELNFLQGRLLEKCSKNPPVFKTDHTPVWHKISPYTGMLVTKKNAPFENRPIFTKGDSEKISVGIGVFFPFFWRKKRKIAKKKNRKKNFENFGANAFIGNRRFLGVSKNSWFWPKMAIFSNLCHFFFSKKWDHREIFRILVDAPPELTRLLEKWAKPFGQKETAIGFIGDHSYLPGANAFIGNFPSYFWGIWSFFFPSSRD